MKNKLHPGSALLGAGIAVLAFVTSGAMLQDDAAAPAEDAPAVRIGYLEIVTPELDSTCELIAELQGVEFTDPVPALGFGRTAPLAGGGILSVRKPMHEAEGQVVRPYILVDDIQPAYEAAKAAGVEVAHPPLKLEGQGTFAIYIHGGIQHGLWQELDG